jgi:hypothetical protein
MAAKAPARSPSRWDQSDSRFVRTEGRPYWVAPPTGFHLPPFFLSATFFLLTTSLLTSPSHPAFDEHNPLSMSKLLDRAAAPVRRHRAVATLIGVVAAVGAAAVVHAATSQSFLVSAQPPSQTINSGSSTSYVVSVSPTNGFSGKVTLAASSLPKGTSATWTVGTTTSSGTASMTVSTGPQDATLTIGGGQPPEGTYSPKVTASSGSLSQTATLTLVVQKQNAANFTLSVSPSAQTVAQGTIASTVSIARSNWTGPVSLGPVTGLPANATWALSLTSTTGSSATLTIVTTSSTPPGLYTVVVDGSGVLSGKTASTRYAAFTLNVLPPFSISGNLASPMTLGLGGTQSLNLEITNPYSTPLTVSNIQVTLASVHQAAGASGACDPTTGSNSSNFQINNVLPTYKVTVPPNSTTNKLSLLGSGLTPKVTWIDQPGFAQNGCLGATLNFSYSAKGTF